MFLDMNGRQIFSLSFGAGSRTFLAHGGWVGNSELWLQPFEVLSRSWRTVTYDHRGTGITPSVPDDITREGLVDDLFAVMDRLEIDRCVLAGESSGVLIALLAYFRHPERFEGLVLVDGGPGEPATDDDTGAWLAPVYLDWPAYFHGFIEECIPEAGTDHIRRWGRRIGARSDAALAARLATVLDGVDLRDRLSDVHVPTLVINGTDDRIAGVAGSEALAAGIPDSKLVMIEGAGHVPTMTFPTLVAETINSFFGPLRH